jgi:uncharacterized membrane protein required for colicin V production
MVAMKITWYDLAVILPLLGLVVLEARRPFTRGLLDAVAALVATGLASLWTGVVAGYVRLSPHPTTNTALTFLALFGVLLAAALVASRYVYQFWLQISASPLDAPLGGLAGVALAVIVGHVVTYSLFAYYGGATPSYLSHSTIARGLLDLQSLASAFGARTL